MPTGLPKLSFKNVSRSFADRIILKDISFNLEKGGRYALLGPNGAGKSTLMRLIAGQLRPDEGEILLDGICPWQDAGARLNMGFLSEGIPLAADLTVEEHLNLAAALRGLTKESTEKEKEKLRCDLNLELIYKRPAGLLSHGQARRTALASAVIGSPDFLLLDELSSGLDPEETDRLCVFINNLAPNCTLLISSHILEEVFAWTQKAIIINQGRLISIGQWQTIFPAAVCGQTLRAEYLKFLAADRGCP